MALTPAEKSALCQILKAELKDELRQEMRTDEQASMPHAGDVGPPTEGEMTNKMLSGIADRLDSLHKRIDELESKEEPESNLKAEGRTQSMQELKECADAMGSKEGEI